MSSSSSYLITGGTGFLGGWIITSLLKREKDVKIVVLSRSKDQELSEKGIIFFEGSVLDLNALRKLCSLHGPFSGIFHLAGLVEHSRKNPQPMFDLHVNGTLNVLKIAVEFNIRRVVYSSTSGTVGCFSTEKEIADDSSPYCEKITRNWPYYASKIQAEKEIFTFLEREKKPEVILLRPCLILGPGDHRMSSVTLIDEFLKKNIPIVPSGGVSFLDVRDCAEAFVSAMHKGQPGQTYLLGSINLPHSSLYKHLETLSGIRAPFLRIPVWLLLPFLRILYFLTFSLFGIWLKEKDPVFVEMGAVFWTIQWEKAKRELGFRPRDSLETLRDTILWLREKKKDK